MVVEPRHAPGGTEDHRNDRVQRKQARKEQRELESILVVEPSSPVVPSRKKQHQPAGDRHPNHQEKLEARPIAVSL